MQFLKAGIAYFLVVFGAGFALGTVRVLWVVPRLGTRSAELLEAPLMLAVTILAARWVVRRLATPKALSERLGTGLVALGFLLAAEFLTAVWIRGLTFREYVASRDPVAGPVYVVMLVGFAAMPSIVARR